jgi:hypothetical protein
MTRATWIFACALVAPSLATVGCGDATTEVSGGEPRFDAAAPQLGEGRPSASPTSWTGLYRDIFGPNGTASCAGNGTCHGSKEQLGARSSGGCVCADQEGCRASLLDPSTGLVKPDDKRAPETSGLYAVLRRVEGGRAVGIMPKEPPYTFTEAELTRIKTWIANGALND